MGDATERELVLEISRGNQVAYKQVLEAQLPAVARYVSRMMGGSREAEDITQEVFLRLWTHAGDYHAGQARLTTWLHNIAHNLCIDYFRKHKRIVHEPPADDIEGGPEPDRQFFVALTSEQVRQGVMRLPERQRSALILCHFQGLTNKDAAIILDVSVDALESLLARARRKLKTSLSDNYDSEQLSRSDR
ncbi:MAG: sigma-70 family RNA polymerase sigma factor [Pseudomonadales bacterium]